jgi:hypothetical protein
LLRLPECSPDALEALVNRPRTTRERVMSNVDALARGPFGAPNVKKRVGVPGHGLRVGDRRVLWGVESGRPVVRVLETGPRAGVYG